jgi:hypothetical protein
MMVIINKIKMVLIKTCEYLGVVCQLADTE